LALEFTATAGRDARRFILSSSTPPLSPRGCDGTTRVVRLKPKPPSIATRVSPLLLDVFATVMLRGSCLKVIRASDGINGEAAVQYH